MTNFDVYSPSVAEYENEDIPKIHLNMEDTPWDPSTNYYSERDTCLLNHKDQISIPATEARGPVYISAGFSNSPAYNAADVIDNDNLATALSA